MIKGKKILAIIPARGGSKGIPLKNIYPLLGRPLIEYSILEAKKCPFLDEIIVSTDNLNIAQISQNLGLHIPFMRPEYLASDIATSADVILHTINELERLTRKFDYFILLQPTSPLRKAKHIIDAIEMIANHGKADSLISVTRVRQHPYWMKIVLPQGRLSNFIETNNPHTRRQDLPEILLPNGAIYMSNIDYFKREKSFDCGFTLPFLMDEEDSIDVDSLLDLKIIEMIMKGN